jgi:hypothetical protein
LFIVVPLPPGKNPLTVPIIIIIIIYPFSIWVDHVGETKYFRCGTCRTCVRACGECACVFGGGRFPPLFFRPLHCDLQDTLCFTLVVTVLSRKWKPSYGVPNIRRQQPPAGLSISLECYLTLSSVRDCDIVADFETAILRLMHSVFKHRVIMGMTNVMSLPKRGTPWPTPLSLLTVQAYFFHWSCI